MYKLKPSGAIEPLFLKNVSDYVMIYTCVGVKTNLHFKIPNTASTNAAAAVSSLQPSMVGSV